MIIKTRTSVYEAELKDGKITLGKIAVRAGQTSGVQTGTKEEGECLVITPKGVFLYKENFIPEGDRFSRGTVEKEGRTISPELETSPPEEI